MSSDDEDEEVKLAIAMSLQQTSPVAQPATGVRPETIDLTSDAEEEDEDLRRAIALSLSESNSVVYSESSGVDATHRPKSTASRDSESRQKATRAADNLQSQAIEPTTKPSTFMGLDRKAMEQERLARLGKRKREPSLEGSSKQTVLTLAAESSFGSRNDTKPSQTNVLEYPKGAVKRTSATKYPRTNDITLDELLQAPGINIAVISSFMWDAEWLYEKLDPTKVKQIWIMNAKGQDVQQRWIREMKETGVPNLKVHFPPMEGIIHSMHSKFMLLFGDDKLRFVVPTANMTQIDWGEVANDWQPGVMENSVFLIDLPRRSDGKVGRKNDLTMFGRELVYFLEQQRVSQNVIDGVLKFDFSHTCHLAFVHSIGGSHQSPSDHPTGFNGLAKAIRDLQLDDVKEIKLDYAASSLGAINDKLLQRIYHAARGEDIDTDVENPSVRDHLHIYFPTHDTVEKSIGGIDCGGIITLTRQNYNASTFPRECLRNYESNRRGMLSHNKLLFARGRRNDGKPFAWLYIGSANVSEAAWGTQKALKGGQLGKLNIRNWECGVVVPVPESKLDELRLGRDEIPPMSAFEGTIEIPFVFPGCAYGEKQPWFFRSG